MTNLERTNPELRAALIIVKLNFGRREDRVLPILRRVLCESQVKERRRRAA